MMFKILLCFISLSVVPQVVAGGGVATTTNERIRFPSRYRHLKEEQPGLSQECQDDTDKLYEQSPALDKADEAMMASMNLDISGDFKQQTLSVPQTSVEEYQEICEAAGGQIQGVKSATLECTMLGVTTTTYLENMVSCFAPACQNAAAADFVDEVFDVPEQFGPGMSCQTTSLKGYAITKRSGSSKSNTAAATLLVLLVAMSIVVFYTTIAVKLQRRRRTGTITADHEQAKEDTHQPVTILDLDEDVEMI